MGFRDALYEREVSRTPSCTIGVYYALSRPCDAMRPAGTPRYAEQKTKEHATEEPFKLMPLSPRALGVRRDLSDWQATHLRRCSSLITGMR
jgi:hypothetical protein